MSVDIATENALSGTYTFGDMHTGTQYGDLSVAGFARQPSVNVGDTIEFCTDGSPSSIQIYRCGWYGGTNAFRLVDTISATPATQPEATTIANSNGGTSTTDWTVTASWNVPSTAVSGMYMAMIRNAANNDAFYASFVVRDDDAYADIIYKTSDTTWGAAYNHYGTKSAVDGKDVYGSGTGVGNIMERCFAVSYHRPQLTMGGVVQTFWWACEIPLIRFLERQGYTIKYVTGVDLDKQGVSLLADKSGVFISSGHDEYWSETMRDAVEDWRDNHAGRSIFMSGNEVFWKTRFEYNGDETIMWCHKDTMPGPTGFTRSAGEPLDPVAWTGTWKDTRWADNRPEWLLTGTDFRMNGMNEFDPLVLSNPYGGHPVWGGSSLVDGDVTFIKALGFEGDSLRPTQPEGSFKVLAAYTRNINGSYADDNGQNYSGNGDLTWGIVSQRYSGGGVTVGFGTCQWSWTLDGTHDRGTTTPQPAAQQFMINLLRDLGAEPTTLMSGVSLQPQNSLDVYGLDPSSAGWRKSDGSRLYPFLMVESELVQLN